MSTQIRNTHIGRLSLEINGTEGDLVLQSKDNFMFQIDSFLLKGARGTDKAYKELLVPAHYNPLPPELQAGSAFNVAQLYLQIYGDLRNNTNQAPDFRTGLAAHELIDKIRLAAETGERQKV